MTAGSDCGAGDRTVLLRLADHIDRECIRCGNCLRHCGFLANYDPPGDVAGSLAETIREQDVGGSLDRLRPGYFCSLCFLCTAVCPKQLPMAELFLACRRYHVALSGGTGFREHRRLLAYEALGRSRLTTFCQFPPGCDTLFFPGCSLPGLRPHLVLQLHARLRDRYPQLGLLLDCCSKPSHDLGFQQLFTQRFRRLLDRIQSSGVQRLIVGCPSCYQVFSNYAEELEVDLIYEYLPDLLKGKRGAIQPVGNCTLHDPCTLRFEPQIQRQIRDTLSSLGGSITEMRHSRKRTLCCGEGGGAGLLANQPTCNWRELRLEESAEQLMFTLCGGCTTTLCDANTHHLLDLFDTGHPWNPQKPRRLPVFQLSYLNRFALKLRLLLHRYLGGN